MFARVNMAGFPQPVMCAHARVLLPSTLPAAATYVCEISHTCAYKDTLSRHQQTREV